MRTLKIFFILIFFASCDYPVFEEITTHEIIFSHAAGIYCQPFDLRVSIPTRPPAEIFFTIDGTEPQITSQRLCASGIISVTDRSGNWQNAPLTRHSDTWERFGNVLPAPNAEILQGTTFRFRGFANGKPVTETVTATYIIAENAEERFNNLPIISVTAPQDDFIFLYSELNPLEAHRKIFNYEYFYNGEQIFNLPGSSSLGGWGSRASAQRTFNVHFSRGQLNGVITHPIFTDLDELYRFRLWNGGSSFGWDFMRDPFAQAASAQLNLPFSDNQLAIKFVNGEYWGFTNLREHTSNAHFISTRLGLPRGNIAIMNRDRLMDENGVRVEIDGVRLLHDTVSEGNEIIVKALYFELLQFLQTHDMSSDYAREKLFSEFFCQENFTDYLISNTFFANTDWPHNNVRFFRAITPTLGNPYADGRWRFILHDMDYSLAEYENNRFTPLLEGSSHAREGEHFNHVFMVLNNPTFAAQFTERALYVLENYFNTEKLTALHDEFAAQYEPILPEMFNRFAIHGTAEDSLKNFNEHQTELREFILNRQKFFLEQLNDLT
jgi:hypothetical protein